MPVAKKLVRPLSDLYSSLPVDRDDRRPYVIERRAEIKLLVDTIWEQVIAELLEESPRNHVEARHFINGTNLSMFAAHDREVLRSLDAVLQMYGALDGDPYIDRSKPLVRLVTHKLSRLCWGWLTIPSIALVLLRGDFLYF